LELTKEISQENIKYKSLLHEKDEVINRQNTEINEIKKTLSEINLNISSEITLLQQKFDSKTVELASKISEFDKLDIENKRITAENFELQTKLSSYEQLICAHEDINSKFDSYESRINLLTEQKRKLEKELENSAALLEAMENKYYTLDQNCVKLQQNLRQKDLEIATLVCAVKDLKLKLRVYVPVKVFFF